MTTPDLPPARADLPPARADLPPARTDLADQEWRRLSPRMLLIHPVREAARAIPALAGLLIAGRSSGQGQLWALIGVGALIGFSILRWYTTRFRITSEQVQLRTGLLRRKSVSTPADRVRSVDVTASVLHRVLGLAKVQIGTGDKDSGLELDSLTAAEAHQLRAELLHRATRSRAPAAHAVPDQQPYDEHVATAGGDDVAGLTPAAGPASAAGQAPAACPAPAGPAPATRPMQPDAIRHAAWEGEVELARLDPTWVRFAPFTASGIVTTLAIFGLAWRIGDELDVNPSENELLKGAVQHLQATPLWLDIVQAVVAIAVLTVVLAIGGYVLSYWGFRLTRHQHGTLHLTRGLLTTRATSIEERRLRGVELNDSLLLRVVRGARLEAITTGLNAKRESGGRSLLVPPAPMAVVRAIAGAVLTDPGALDLALVAHGPMARRRRYVRAIVPWVVLTIAVAVVLAVSDWLPGWVLVVPLALLAASPLLAADRYRNLGHAVGDVFLVSRSGSLHRSQAMLSRAGIIGWNLEQTFFQRRAGVATLTATTAAGDQGYPVLDVPLDQAIAVAAVATPGLLDELLVRAH